MTPQPPFFLASFRIRLDVCQQQIQVGLVRVLATYDNLSDRCNLRSSPIDLSGAQDNHTSLTVHQRFRQVQRLQWERSRLPRALTLIRWVRVRHRICSNLMRQAMAITQVKRWAMRSLNTQILFSHEHSYLTHKQKRAWECQ